MPCPTGEQAFFYIPVDTPVVNSDPAEAKPVGITVELGDDVDFVISAAFDCPVDVTLSVFAPGVDPQDIFYIDSEASGAERLSKAIADDVKSNSCSTSGESEDDIRKAFENLVFYKTNVTGLDVPIESLHARFDPGLYIITLGVTPHGMKGKTLYRWSTGFFIP